MGPARRPAPARQPVPDRGCGGAGRTGGRRGRRRFCGGGDRGARGGPEPRPAGGGPARGRPSCRGRRCGLGQDACPHAAHRTPRRLGRGALADTRHHLHQQGRRRDAPARRGARRSRRRQDVGVHLPCRLRADPAPQCGTDRLRSRLHYLRRRRQPPARRARARRPRHRPEALPTPGRARGHQLGQVGHGRRRAVRRARRDDLRAADRRGLRRVRAAPRRGQRHGLRRPPGSHRAHVPRAPRRARALPGTFRARPRGRVPGHQHRPERARDPARRGKAQRVCRGRHRPEHLPVPGRRDAQPARVRAGVPRRPHDRARPELPLDPDDPGCRQRRHRQQPVPPGKGALERARQGRPDQALPGRRRPGRGQFRDGRDRGPAPGREHRLWRHRRLLPDQRPEPRARRPPWPIVGSPTP